LESILFDQYSNPTEFFFVVNNAAPGFSKKLVFIASATINPSTAADTIPPANPAPSEEEKMN